jgi:cobalt-zinc-cadmium efflux system membrane fusion protein
VVTADGDWCAGHGVPESKCTLCHPELIAGFKETGDWCAEHQLPESVCPQCNPERADLFPIEQRVVRFINPAKEIEVGIATVPVRQAAQAITAHGPARVAFDADRMADLRAVVHGIVKHIHMPLGARVERGQILFTLVSTEIAETQSKLRTAKARARVAKTNLQRQQSLADRNIASRYDVEQAETELETALAEVASAETILTTAGASEAGEPGQFIITAPIAGTLIHRSAVIGALATDETSLGMIADTSRMWVFGDIPEQDARVVHLGAEMFFSGDDGAQAAGPIAWIGSEVNRETRTVPVRATVANPKGDLRAHQFGRVRIETRQSQAAWLVPAAAIQRVEQKDVVFVRREPGLYAPREVRRMGSGEWTLVEGRLLEGEQVVTTGAVLLRTEMLPGSIGAGCCEVEPLGAVSKVQ